MSLLIAAVELALQQPPVQQLPPLREDFPASRQLSPAHDIFEDEFQLASPAGRAELHRFAACVADKSPGLAAETLQRDFRSARYRNALRRLARNNETCFRRRGALRSNGLPFAGSLAEHLLARDSTPINVRLARAAARPAVPFYSVTDQIALCVARSVPDEVARLFGSEIASDAEAVALRRLEPVVRVCGQSGPRLEAAPAALRAMIATATFRTVAAPDMNEEGS